MVNKVILLGNVGAEPEVKVFENGVKVARLRVATSERWNDKDGNKHEETEWHNITLWRGLADIAERYVHRGSQIYVEGKITYREYEVNGEKRYATDIVANDMKLCGRAKDANDIPM